MRPQIPSHHIHKSPKLLRVFNQFFFHVQNLLQMNLRNKKFSLMLSRHEWIIFRRKEDNFLSQFF